MAFLDTYQVTHRVDETLYLLPNSHNHPFFLKNQYGNSAERIISPIAKG